MTTHFLKCWPEYFEAVMAGDKTFEVRLDDRDFAVGDVLVLQEYRPPSVRTVHAPTAQDYEKYGRTAIDGVYTGREITRTVTYKLKGGVGDFTPLSTGWCVLGIKPLDEARVPIVGTVNDGDVNGEE